MSIEERLKELILHRYSSVREFTITIGMPNSTLESIFKRGIGNSSVTNVIKICKALGISADALADGEIKPSTERSAIMFNEELDVINLAEDTKRVLRHGSTVTIDGEPISTDQIDYIVDGIDLVVEIAKRKKP